MNWPLVYRLSRPRHRRVAMSGMDNLWKHLRGKPASRSVIVWDSSKMMRLIGFKCKHSNVLSWEVLISRFLLGNLEVTKNKKFCRKKNRVPPIRVKIVRIGGTRNLSRRLASLIFSVGVWLKLVSVWMSPGDNVRSKFSIRRFESAHPNPLVLFCLF